MSAANVDVCKCGRFQIDPRCLCSRIILEVGLRVDVVLWKRAPRPAVQQPCRASLQQVPSALYYGSSWAGPWVWRAPCVAPRGARAARCAGRHGPSLDTSATMPGTMPSCTSYWAWLCPCCSSCTTFCCRCKQRPCLAGRALGCCGCRSVQGPGSEIPKSYCQHHGACQVFFVFFFFVVLIFEDFFKNILFLFF